MGGGEVNKFPSAAVSQEFIISHSVTTISFCHIHRYFINPKPSIRDVLDNSSAVMDAINRSLKMGVNRGCRLSVNVRTDVLKFLFEGKCRQYPHEAGHLYTLEDFDKKYFPTDWHRVYDRLGDGCKVQFPLRMVSKVKWSTTMYTSDSVRGMVLPKKKHFYEVCILWLVKQCCSFCFVVKPAIVRTQIHDQQHT